MLLRRAVLDCPLLLPGWCCLPSEVPSRLAQLLLLQDVCLAYDVRRGMTAGGPLMGVVLLQQQLAVTPAEAVLKLQLLWGQCTRTDSIESQ
jgi:hypothetical protein